MSWLIILLFSAPLVALMVTLGAQVQILLMLLIGTTFFSGRIISRLADIDEPFLGFVVGFAAVSHLFLAAELFAPAGTAVVLCLLSFAAYKKGEPGRASPSILILALLVSIFTYLWCADLPSRLIRFHSDGKLDFWIDIVVHAATMAQFSADSMVGRGMALMADVPRPLYHTASYMPAALIARVLHLPSLDAAVLIWVPLGILTMASGIVALGLALKNGRLAMMALAATALLPNPEQLPLKNPFLGFSWLLETGPGTPYALGISCAAIATLVHWIRRPQPALFTITVFLLAACFLVRVNVFIWLAPVILLGFILGLRGFTAYQRLAMITVGLTTLCGVLVAISWARISHDPQVFLFSYLDMVHIGQTPTAYEGLYSGLIATFGRLGAAIAGIGLVMVGTLGPWLLVFALSALALVRKNKLDAEDAIPFILIAVAVIAIILAPVPQNGDISEFRHRAGPLLVIIISVWSLRFLAAAAEPVFQTARSQFATLIVIISTAISFTALAVNISWARHPKMDWASEFYGRQFDPALLQLASILKGREGHLVRFVVAGQPRNARNIDDAALLVALSGIPAYISCPESLLLRDDYVGLEANIRMNITDELTNSATIEILRAKMTSEDINYYIITPRSQGRFDPKHDGAVWKSGGYALYAAH